VELSSETVIEASAERVWEIVGLRFARIGEWTTAIPVSRPSPRAVVEAEAPVAARVCETGVRMDEAGAPWDSNPRKTPIEIRDRRHASATSPRPLRPLTRPADFRSL
jgi:hypothetical protein